MKKFIKYMKELFGKIVVWVRGVLGTLLDHFKGVAKVAVEVTTKLKFIVESEALDVAVDLIPGDVDNKILDKVRVVLPQVIKRVSLVAGIVSESDSNSEAIQKFIAHLRTLNPEGRKAFWVTFAAEMNIALTDGKLTFAEAVILTQLSYTEFVKSKK
jgi:hypothetical protein